MHSGLACYRDWTVRMRGEVFISAGRYPCTLGGNPNSEDLTESFGSFREMAGVEN